MKKILFSPVGNTDPWRNDLDGAMLHIVRHYQPDKVILFFTESIWEGTDKFSGHKEYKWEDIIQHISPNCEVVIEKHKIDRAHDFDAYKTIFHRLIQDEKNKFPQSDILLNVTSGTPQMEATLCLEYVTYPEQLTCIQVSSPLNNSNARTKFANPDTAEIDIDIVQEEESKSPNRCAEIQILSFREAIVRNQMKELIDAYDYEAARLLLASQKAFNNGKIIKNKLTEMIDDIRMHRIPKTIQQKHWDKNLQKALFHYLLLSMRFKRKDVSETLIRSKSLAEFIAEHYIKDHYPALILVGNDHMPKLNPELSSEFTAEFTTFVQRRLPSYEIDFNRPLGFPAYLDLLMYHEADSEFVKYMKSINDINALRNKVAHNLDELQLNRDKNEKRIKQAIQSVQKMLVMSFPVLTEDDFSYFDQFNQDIKELL